MSPKAANPFRSAEAVQPHVKTLVYGAPGVGKTYFALGTPGGRLAVIDTEGGTVHYAGRNGITPFDVLQTKTYAEVRAAVAYLAANPGAYAGLVIDPVTVLYETLQDAAQIKRAARRGDEDADLEMLDWGRIKRFYKALMTEVINLPLHVVVTAREKDETVRRGDQMVKVGVKPDAEKGTAYYFDTVLHMTADADARRVQVVKDRTGTLALGAVVEGPTFAGLFGAYLKGKGTAERHVPDDAAAAAADAAAMPGGVAVAGAVLAAAVEEALDAIGQDPDAILARFGWASFAEAPRDKVEAVLARAAKAAAKAAPAPEPAPDPDQPAEAVVEPPVADSEEAA